MFYIPIDKYYQNDLKITTPYCDHSQLCWEYTRVAHSWKMGRQVTTDKIWNKTSNKDLLYGLIFVLTYTRFLQIT